MISNISNEWTLWFFMIWKYIEHIVFPVTHAGIYQLRVIREKKNDALDHL